LSIINFYGFQNLTTQFFDLEEKYPNWGIVIVHAYGILVTTRSKKANPLKSGDAKPRA
jgi:hypothetical protein